MRKLLKYEGQTVMYPNGELATPERVYADYPAAQVFTFVFQTDESMQVMMSMDNLSVLRGVYGIDSALTEEEAVREIESILNMPVETEETEVITPEERIAAVLEYQMLTTIPDETAEGGEGL